ncbi:four-carbon acid sugar kinase family protein [Pseudaminobacter sp. 19-2017]|uniref:Four-carbon acid sugar kinase family protein n=1 Tax=Pseudaminobacter soli (ex Zhang et al. 2022) TaxID=2831468 RepID=A0A942DYG8_9HYPH|nr:four-carbon acid sugar kinase family protein [Pseudaminobacter soli]MBS3647813.1 four-carbon acid sugar kinase family protein [Pseudaminobacter soli]
MQDLLLSYYGDDLTGSTDVMEALSLGGVSTVLFLRQPDEELLSRFGDCRAVGLAGTARSQTPDWMDAHLSLAFEWLKGLGAALCHYKVCSTFDSSPAVGSIGRAIEIGRGVFGDAPVPVVVGAPQIRRYTAFANLFARYREHVYRIDRHPVMSRHPVTPMDEADLLLHLGKQTALKSGLVDLAAIGAGGAATEADRLSGEGAAIILFDVASAETQRSVGAEIWRRRASSPFVVGSSGVEYALINAWKTAGLAPGPASYAGAGEVDRLAVVSGSVSPTTERQIAHALANGFDGIALDPLELVCERGDVAMEDAIRLGNASLTAGRSVILYTAMGPQADRGSEIDEKPGARHLLGRRIGTILQRLIAEQGLKRAVIAGGDTSSHALGELGVDALTVLMPLPQTPGSPLCTAHSRDARVDGLQIALKGGQIGHDDYFETIRRGALN